MWVAVGFYHRRKCVFVGYTPTQSETDVQKLCIEDRESMNVLYSVANFRIEIDDNITYI